MRTATALMVLAFIALAGSAAAQRRDEALDSLMLSSSLQPVNDPIPRLLQEALASAATKPGTYGSPSPITAPSPSPIVTEVVPAAPSPSPKPKSGSSSAAAGAASLAAAAAAAALLL